MNVIAFNKMEHDVTPTTPLAAPTERGINAPEAD